MAFPDLKFVSMAYIQNQVTVSVMDKALKSRAQTSEVPAIQGEEVKDDTEVSEFQAAIAGYLGDGTRFKKRRREVTHVDRPRHDKDSLREHEMENVAVWINEDPGSNTRHASGDPQQQEWNEKFKQYKHHHFLNKWGTLGKSGEKDEEWWIEDPQVLPEDDPEYLCEMCRHINFKVLLTERTLPGNDIPGPTKIRLRQLDQMIKRKSCGFCRLITRKMEVDGVFDMNDEEALYYSDVRLNVVDEGEENDLRLEVELFDDLRRWDTQRYIIRLCRSADAQPLRAIPINKDNIDPALLRSWLEVCERSHPTDRVTDQGLQRLRLIDVVDQRICEIDLPCRYVCLSYVWGGMQHVLNTDKLRSSMYQTHGLTPESVVLPKTITDAMEVTRWLNIRYLWVDALCIEQDNEADKKISIAAMSSIYSGATVTVVASTNRTPMEGLPGVTTVSRSHDQIHERIQGMDLYVAFNDARLPLGEIESSKWNSRGWTYQERQLSNRAVFFTESQMIFVCSDTTFFEDTVPPHSHQYKSVPIDQFDGPLANPQELHFKIWFDRSQIQYTNKAFQTDDGIVTMIGKVPGETGVEENDMQGLMNVPAPLYEHKTIPKQDTNGMLQVQQRDIWNTYREAVASYSQRDLTDTRDVIPAFKGLSDMIRQGANIQFWYNLPDCAFMQALLWCPETVMKRRQYDGENVNPSWTWAGWEGAVRYRGRGWYNSIHGGPVSAVRWLQVSDPQTWLDTRRESLIEQGADIAEVERNIADGDMTTIEGANPHELYRFNAVEDGWQVAFLKERNQNSFVHMEHYGPIVFPYPIPLTDQPSITLPDASGKLYFMAYTSKIQFTDMPNTPVIKEPNTDAFLQIGLNDEDKSANFRPSWQRIIYHQGYRAGFLTLNIPFTDLDLTSPDKYRLVAMSRDDLPTISTSPESLPPYRQLDPLDLHIAITYAQYYQTDPSEFTKKHVNPPKTDLEHPTSGPANEDGDAHWDGLRFDNDVAYPLYNVLLVEQVDTMGGIGSVFERRGSGRMHFHAFHHAVSASDAADEMDMVILR